MFRILIIATIILLSFAKSLAETNLSSRLLKGKITSVDEQIMFATVGIIKENIGTITDHEGNFELKIPNNLTDQQLTVSHIGYQSLNLSIDSLLNLNEVTIELSEKIELLQEVAITADKLVGKAKEYGNKKVYDLFLSIQKGERGSEIATLITPKKGMFLNAISVNVSNEAEKEFTLLLNIYGVDKETKLPGEQLLSNQKIIQSKLVRGWLEVDLEDENLTINEPFFVSFQWVNLDGYFPLIGGEISSSKKSLVRYKALGTWESFANWNIKVKGTTYKVVK